VRLNRKGPGWLLLPAVGVALSALVFSSSSSAQTPEPTPPGGTPAPSPSPGAEFTGPTYTELLAEELDVTVQALREAAKQAGDRFIDQLVQNGVLSQQQADALRTVQRDQVLDYLTDEGEPYIREVILLRLADVIGIDKRTLDSERADGRSIEEIADQRGVTVEELRSDLDRKADEALAIVRQLGLIEAEADLTDLRERIDEIIDSVLDGNPTADDLATPTPGGNGPQGTPAPTP
jgi:polyhydroxyalkanoate synthesis regulator phasin